MKKYLSLFLCVIALGTTQVAFTEPATPQMQQVAVGEPVEVTLLQEEESIQPGRPFWVATRLKLSDKWHAYWKNPGDAGMAPNIEWTLPDGFTADKAHFPYPQRFSAEGAVGYGYENEVILLTEITPPAHLNPNQELDLKAELSWVVCSDSTCLPGDAKVVLQLPVKEESPVIAAGNTTHFAKARHDLPKKHEKITAHKKGNIVQIELPHSDEKISGQFFTELEQTIKDHEISDLQPLKKKLGHHALAIEAKDEQKAIKGVLVLQTKNGVEAFDIDTELTELAQEEELVKPVSQISTANVIPSQHIEFEGGVGLAIILAFAGGLLLNMMPCVLPVLSFKVLSFVKMAGESRSKTLAHGIAFTMGVLVSFWTVAGVLLALQAYGSSVGWGFQLQEPIFVAILAAVLFIFGLSLFGVFEMGTSIASKAGQAQAGGKKEGLFASFFSGILATAVATPCTGPFLGSAVGFAVTQPAILSMLIFTSLGLGMASPYLLLAAYPKLLRFMPKPGAWMETFKELMGFLMLASVLWLVWVFGAQTNGLAISILLGGFFFMAIGCWVYGKFGTPIRKKATRYISYALTAALFATGGYALYTATTPWVEAMGGGSGETSMAQGEWEKFDPARIIELQKQGIPVFVDFTAKWCLICQTNHLALSTNSVAKEFEKQGMVKMKADWTKRDPVITEELKKFGRSGVPLYVIYGTDPSKAPEVLPQVLTPDVVIDYIKKEEASIASQ